jgi:hypothetical protein
VHIGQLTETRETTDRDAGDHALHASTRVTLSCLHDDLRAALFNVRRPAPLGSLRQLFVFPSYFLQATSRLRERLLMCLSERLFRSVAPVLWVCEVLVVNHFITALGYA